MLPASEVMQDVAPRVGAEGLRGLFAQLADGGASALAPLYDALADDVHGLALWRTGNACDAADVLQEVFLRLARAGHRLRDVRDPRAFVLSTAHRCSLDVHRQRRRRGETELVEAALPLTTPDTPERQLDCHRVNAALLELPAEQREAVHLHALLGLTFKETARVTGVPTFTAASRFRLGLARLRRLLGATP